MEWQPVIGLEIHTRLKTESKLFSGASAQYGAEPNAHTCELDLALPGTLPVLNQRVLELAIRLGLAIDADIPAETVFVRKHYFYPDLPKGYQISQFEAPVVQGGHLEITLPDTTTRTIRINRAHIEEDAGKSIHTQFQTMSGVDFNRAGTPLMEIVSEPDLFSAVEAGAYMREIHRLVQYLDICDGNMQEGSFRCDANVSVRPKNRDVLGTRTEIKNLNSFRFIEKAIDYEIERQIAILESGGEVTQETRLFDVESGETRIMRGKEESHDYQYFPDPDLLPVKISRDQIEQVRNSMPELPAVKARHYRETLGLKDETVNQLLGNKSIAGYFEACVDASKAPPQLVANWVTGTLMGALKQAALPIEQSPVSAESLAQLLDQIADNTISNSVARQVFSRMWSGAGSASEIIATEGLQQSNDTEELERIIDRLVENSPRQLAQYRSGKTKLLGFFVGCVMKETKGKADPEQVSALVKKRLSS